MTETQLRQSLVDMAKSYLGASEGSSKHHEIVDTYNTITPLPVSYTLQYDDDWCAGFVSAMAQLCGLTSVVLPECSCTRMIALYEAIGRFEENDAYIPEMGDIIMYEWNIETTGDLTGDADHVGIVTACDGSTITVIEGNKDDTVAYRSVSVNGDRIRGFCLPDYESLATADDTSDTKKIWDYFYLRIGNAYGVAGLMGNLEAESGLYPDRIEGDIPYSDASKEYTAKVDSGAISESEFVNSGTGYGLAQWTYYTRKQGLYDLWKSGDYDTLTTKASIGSLDIALDYLWHELTTDYPGVLSVLRSATSVREASDKVLHDFENPADQSTAVEEKRESMSMVWYNKYVNYPPGGGGGDVPSTPTWTPSSERKRMSLLLMVCAGRGGQ